MKLTLLLLMVLEAQQQHQVILKYIHLQVTETLSFQQHVQVMVILVVTTVDYLVIAGGGGNGGGNDHGGGGGNDGYR